MASAAEQMAANLSFANFSKATELKSRIWFTLGALVVFRLISFVPLPGIDPLALSSLFEQTRGGVLDFFNMFSGGALERMSEICTQYRGSHLIEAAGHWVQQERAEEVNALLAEFLSAAKGAPNLV